MDYLESVGRRSALVADFVDSPTISMPENLELLEVGGGDSGGFAGGCGSRSERGWERKTRASFRWFGQREAEVEMAAVADKCHWWWIEE